MVFLGLPDEALKPSESSVAHFTDSQLGGRPHWLYSSSELPVCALCGNTKLLATQIYAPTSNSSNHRVLYLFVCAEPPCQNKNEAWTVLRSMRECEKKKVIEKQTSAALFEDDWGVGVDDWGGGTSEWDDQEVLSDITTNGITENLEALNVSDEVDVTVGFVDSHSDRPFSPFYVSVIEEPTEKVPKQYADVHIEEEGNGGGGEKYESTKVADKEFYKFYKKLQIVPEQCIRYDLGGAPLLQPSDTAIQKCNHCGSDRQFELQLTPALISILKLKDSPKKSVLDFRSVLVYSCRNDCFVKTSQEVAICLPEPEVVIPNMPSQDEKVKLNLQCDKNEGS